jgi:hypothetical protein
VEGSVRRIAVLLEAEVRVASTVRSLVRENSAPYWSLD